MFKHSSNRGFSFIKDEEGATRFFHYHRQYFGIFARFVLRKTNISENL